MKRIAIIMVTGFLTIGIFSCTPDKVLAETTEQACCGDDEHTPPPPPPPPPPGNGN